MSIRTRLIFLIFSIGLVPLITLCMGLTSVAHPAGDPVFADEKGYPLANTALRLLCYATAGPAPSFLVDLPAKTDANGRLDAPLPTNCHYLAAMRLLHEQPSGKAGHGIAYGVYATSWLPGSSEPVAATGTITISRERPLVLFNVVASLAWQPAPGSPFVTELEDGLRQLSAYLYDLTEGQMALGPVTIHTGGYSWDAADLRFLTANDYRPAAFIGGMVAAPVPYTAATGAETVYAPGAIFLGRYWDGLDASDPLAGAWYQEEAYRTLAHEWGHYALFLYDEYRQVTGAETYCICDDLPEVGQTPGACGGLAPALAASVMAYHYTAAEFWHASEHGLPNSCLETEQMYTHGESDWETLLKWTAIQGVADNWLVTPAALTAGPELGLVADLFGRRPGFQLYLPLAVGSGAPVATTFEPAVTVTFSGAAAYGLHPQVYMVGPATGDNPARIMHQGTTNGLFWSPGTLGEVTLLGVRPGDRARVYVDRYPSGQVAGGRFIYPTPGGSDPPLTPGQELPVGADSWRASLDASYGLTGSRLTTMTVTLRSPEPLLVAPLARLCLPAAAIGCPDDPAWRKLMQPDGPGRWMVTFTAPAGEELPLHALLWLDAGSQGELMRWFQVAGGVGPAHMDGFAPLRDGRLMADSVGSAPGEHNRVVFMPAAEYRALEAPLPPGIGGILGVPFDVNILLPENHLAGPRGLEQDQPLPVPVLLTLFYSQRELQRLDIFEEQLRFLHYSRLSGQWLELPVVSSSFYLHWLTGGPIQVDGIYAIGWASFTTSE